MLLAIKRPKTHHSRVLMKVLPVNNDSEFENMKQQLIDLQTQLVFQEDVIQALDKVVTRQQQQIENLHELFKSQKSQIEQITDSGDSDIIDTRPPHY